MACHVLVLFLLLCFGLFCLVARLTPRETFAARFVAAAASSTRQILTQFVAKFSTPEAKASAVALALGSLLFAI